MIPTKVNLNPLPGTSLYLSWKQNPPSPSRLGARVRELGHERYLDESEMQNDMSNLQEPEDWGRSFGNTTIPWLTNRHSATGKHHRVPNAYFATLNVRDIPQTGYSSLRTDWPHHMRHHGETLRL